MWKALIVLGIEHVHDSRPGPCAARLPVNSDTPFWLHQWQVVQLRRLEHCPS